MSWAKVHLGRFLKVRDNRYKPNDKAIAGLKRIDKIDFSGEIFISDKPSNTDMILVKKGDLVISGINVEKGAMAVYTGEKDITATIHYSSYYFNENEIDIEFLKHFLKSLEFKKALKEQVPGGIKTEIKPKHILPLLVDIPTDIKDQRAVVKLLQVRNSKVEAISNELNHQLSLVKKLRQQFLQDAIQGKLVEQNKKDEPASELLKKIKAEKEKLIKEKKLKRENELPPIKPEEIPFEIPENWVWCRLNDICDAIVDCPHSTPHYIENETGYYGIDTNCINEKGEITRLRSLSFESYQERIRRLVPKENDIVYAREGSIGLATFIPKDKNICLGQRVMLFRASKAITHSYLICAVTDVGYKNRLLAKHRGMGAKHVNVKDIVESLIALPPLAEQTRIVQKVDQLMQYCNELEASIRESLSQNDKLLLQVLREALRPDVRSSETLQLPVLQAQEENHFVKRKVLASYIINRSLNDSRFGDVKFEKLLHLSDYFALKRNLGQKYFQQAAGPYDNAFTRAYFQQIETSKWFKRTRNGNQFVFSAGQNHSKSTNTYGYFSEEELKRVDGIISYFKKYDYEQPEIISTLYAVWNNRIIKQEPITDDLLKQDFLNWDAKKIKYKDRLDAALNWMRKENFVPDGWGKVIEKAKRKGKYKHVSK